MTSAAKLWRQASPLCRTAVLKWNIPTVNYGSLIDLKKLRELTEFLAALFGIDLEKKVAKEKFGEAKVI
jgi:hypothetical protein